jgi:AAA+ superfamily predicted ATPase
MRRANESVLLIDEFQSLCRKDAGDSEPTGNEVISILNHGMTDPHQRFCLIITGYADEILDGLKNTLDRGFTSRLEDNIIVIDDYPPEVLMQILLDNIEMQHCKVDGALITPTQFKSKAVAPLLCYLDRIYSERDKSFANARTMELLASKVCMQALHSHDGLVTEACFYTDGVTHDNFTPMFLEDTPEEIMGELNELIGLQTVKEQVKHLFNLKKYNEMVSSMGLPTSRPSLHMVMYGNPGTGKTTVARLLGRLYKSIGVLSRGHVICVKREDLVAGYVGQTAIKTKERLEEAEGGILFIDEAYSLTPLGSINDFGRESVETILAYMEDHRDNIMVIVAGYPAEMDTFLDSNPGLASRFTSYINFEDYSCEELMQILALFCKKQKMLMTEGAVATAYDTLSHWKVTRGSRFGNARDVRTIFERSIQQHASRVVEEEKCNLTKEELLTLTEEDFSGIQP